MNALLTRSHLLFFFLFCTILFQSCDSTKNELVLEKGILINSSTKIVASEYLFDPNEDLNDPLIIIRGKDIVVDFQGATIRSIKDPLKPDQFIGTAILIENSANVTIKNLNIHGFKVAIMADRVDSMTIANADLSYNYRQKLKSIREREDLSDWLSYHQNEQDEWLRYGAAIYLKQCEYPTLKALKVTGGQNGIMMTETNHGLFYNNTIQFNSGIGIGLYRSSQNRIMHNRLDWNVRGYSHDFYSRGQDSAGILCYEQSNENIFAYNSATHSGDGFFLWAGQSTMDSGKGGCNDNIILANDFSFAPTNGIEVTFSKNQIIGNLLEGCTYGIWGGYSYECLIANNVIVNNRYGIAIEHGNNNRIFSNRLEGNELGVYLWERENQPSDWGFSQNRDVSSTRYNLSDNQFVSSRTPFKIVKTTNAIIRNNHLLGFGQLVDKDMAINDMTFESNLLYQEKGYEGDQQILSNNILIDSSQYPAPIERPVNYSDVTRLEEGMDVNLAPNFPKGRAYILVNEWGPYDFQSPIVWLREIRENEYVFEMLGPPGEWNLIDYKGFTIEGNTSGTFPTTFIARITEGAEVVSLDFEYKGEQVSDQFGRIYEAGETVTFGFERFEKQLSWDIQYFEYDDSNHPLNNQDAFTQMINTSAPKHSESKIGLAYSWWDSPGGDVHPDRFATVARSQFNVSQGEYIFSVTSDDGVKVYLDDKMIIDHWDIHVPATDEILVNLDGQHEVRIEHFEGGGFSTLNFLMKPN